MFPLRHGGLGLRMQPDGVSHAAFVASAGQAQCKLKGRPAVLCPLHGVSGASVQPRCSSLCGQYAGRCGWVRLAGKGLPAEFSDSAFLWAMQLLSNSVWRGTLRVLPERAYHLARGGHAFSC